VPSERLLFARCPDVPPLPRVFFCIGQDSAKRTFIKHDFVVLLKKVKILAFIKPTSLLMTKGSLKSEHISIFCCQGEIVLSPKSVFPGVKASEDP